MSQTSFHTNQLSLEEKDTILQCVYKCTMEVKVSCREGKDPRMLDEAEIQREVWSSENLLIPECARECTDIYLEGKSKIFKVKSLTRSVLKEMLSNFQDFRLRYLEKAHYRAANRVFSKSKDWGGQGRFREPCKRFTEEPIGEPVSGIAHLPQKKFKPLSAFSSIKDIVWVPDQILIENLLQFLGKGPASEGEVGANSFAENDVSLTSEMKKIVREKFLPNDLAPYLFDGDASELPPNYILNPKTHSVYLKNETGIFQVFYSRLFHEDRWMIFDHAREIPQFIDLSNAPLSSNRLKIHEDFLLRRSFASLPTSSSFTSLFLFLTPTLTLAL